MLSRDVLDGFYWYFIKNVKNNVILIKFVCFFVIGFIYNGNILKEIM